MKVNNKKMCVVFVLVLLEISSLFLMYKSNSNKEIKLENINENKEIKNNNLLAIMIEKTNGGFQEYTTSNTFPSGYILNKEKSMCVDNNGEKIDNALKYESNSVTVNTGKTSQCYVYLDEKTAANEVKYKNGVYRTGLEGDGYRYFGDGTEGSSTNPNNYVCFGTTSKSDCTGNPGTYMYRIIGSFQEENGDGTINKNSRYHLKLIKKESLSSLYKWNNSNSVDSDWENSTLYKSLNNLCNSETGCTNNIFLGSDTYSYMKNTTWTNKIFSWKWVETNTLYYENKDQGLGFGFTFYGESPRNSYLYELNRVGKSTQPGEWKYVDNKIGLMYASDFMLSFNKEILDLVLVPKDGGVYKNTLRKGWMYLNNNGETNYPDWPEWTISRIGYWSVSGDSVFAIGDSESNIIYYNSANSQIPIRPVFYLKSNATIASGSGTSTDPYILG